MSSCRRARKIRSLSQLKSLLDNASVRLPQDDPPREIVNISDRTVLENDDLLFDHVMADVTPIAGRHRIRCRQKVPGASGPLPNPDTDVISRLNRLVKNGDGFVVSQTPEYMEGSGARAHPELTHRLHRGDFAMQDNIDLHGLSVEDARCSFDAFVSDAIRSGKRAVRVVHGRGLSSPGKPVLKNNLYKWLTTGPWRKWILAFASARRCDGGAGATYILLRSRPAPRRMRKKRGHPKK